MTPDEISYISQDGARWAMRQILRHNLKLGLDRLLLIVMAHHADADGVLYPTQERLAALTGANLRSIERAIAGYAQRGLLRVEGLRQRNGARVNTYYLEDWDLYAPLKWEAQPEVSPTHPTRESGDPVYKPCKSLNNPTRESGGPPGVGYIHPTRESGGPPLSTRCGIQTHPTRESGKDSIEESTERKKDSLRNDFCATNPQAAGPATAMPPPAAPAPAPLAPAEPKVVLGEPAPALELEPQDPPPPRLPGVRELVGAWNDAISGSPLIPLNRPPTRAECVMLTNAIKHPALAGDTNRWVRYCLWAAKNPFCRGETAGGAPAGIALIARGTMIDRWAALPPPPPPSLANMPLAELRKLDLVAVSRDPKKLLELWNNPEVLVQSYPTPVDPREPQRRPDIIILADRDAAMEAATGHRYDPVEGGSYLWNQAQHDPNLMAKLDAIVADCTWTGPGPNDRPKPLRPLQPQKNGPSVDVGFSPTDRSDTAQDPPAPGQRRTWH